MSQSKVVLVIVTAAFFSVVHISRQYKYGVWPFNRYSVQEHFENVKNLKNLYRIAEHSTTKETAESVHLDHVINLLINFLKLHRPNAIVCENVIDLVKIFQRSIQIKVNIYQQLKRLLFIVRMWKIVPQNTINRIHTRFECMQKCTSCIDFETVAKRLTSPKVEVIIGTVEYLLPHAKIYAKHLDECANASETSKHFQ